MTGSLKIRTFPIVCLCSLILVSCENRDDSDKEVGAEARALISLIKNDLDKTKRELTDLKYELQGVMEIQNELVDQIKQLVAADQEKVPDKTEASEPGIRNLIMQMNEQSQNLSRLGSKVTQLNAAIGNLRTTITGQQAAIDDLVNIVEEQAAINEQENLEPQDENNF